MKAVLSDGSQLSSRLCANEPVVKFVEADADKDTNKQIPSHPPDLGVQDSLSK